MNQEEIVAELLSMQDKDYALMQMKIIPTVPADRSVESYRISAEQKAYLKTLKVGRSKK